MLTVLSSTDHTLLGGVYIIYYYIYYISLYSTVSVENKGQMIRPNLLRTSAILL